MFVRMAMFVATLAFLGCTLAAQAKKEPVYFWRGNLKAAKEEARARNVPIMVVVLQDNEESNDGFVTGTLTTPEFRKLADACVTILAHKDPHGTVEADLDGKRVGVCEKFRTITCDEHRHIERQVYEAYFGADGVRTPNVKFCTPDGKVEATLEDINPMTAYSQACAKIVRKIGPGFDRTGLAKAKAELVEAKARLEAGDVAAALGLAQAIAQAAPKAELGVKAQAFCEEVSGRVKKSIDEAKTLAAGGDHWGAAERIDELKQSSQKTPFATEVGAAERDLARTKEGKEALAGIARDRSFKKVFDKARDLEVKGETKRAYAEYARIVQALKDSPLGRRAEARLEALAPTTRESK